MAMVKTPRDNVGQTPVKKKRNKGKITYCILCRKQHLKHEAQHHVHSMLHHREIETVLGKDSRHECHACMAASMGLKEFAQHIATAQHKANLKILVSRKEKPLWLSKALGEEALTRILERNKALRKDEKKALKKRKKKRKQAAGQKRAEMQPRASKKNMAASKIAKLEKSRQENMRTRQQVTYQQGRINAVVQNKENKVSSQQRPFQQRESTLQNQSGRLACFSEEPAPCCPSLRDQFTQSAQQPIYDNNYSVKAESSQTDIYVRRPHNTQGGTTNKPQQSWTQISQHDYYNKQYDVDFTSDHLPQNGAIVFGPNDSTRSPQPGQEPSAHPASANANAAPIREVDVSSMLRQIRRALGLREPCRADREARKQNSQTGDHSRAQHAGAEKEQPMGDSYAKETTLSNPKQATQHCEKSSTFSSDSDGPSNSTERESERPLDSKTSISQCLTPPSESNLNVTRKVRIAHGSAKVQQGTEAVLKSTLNKLLTLSGAKSKINLREMHQEMIRRKTERFKGMPRFGIELTNRLSGQESSTQAEDRDTTLSEGFHWESVADSSSGADCIEIPLLPQETTYNDFNTETESGSQMQEPVEQPDAAQEGCSHQTVGAVSVKTEAGSEGENGDLRANSSASKRKQHVYEDISENEPSGRKRKTKSNKDQDQMDQLLAVSLREDELSHSLQDLDKSLVQARNALQAAYTDVQRLLLLRQQFTAEVNSLRAKRIEILQGMKASTSSAASAASPRPSPLPSPGASSHQPSPSNPASSISPLALPAMPVKKEGLPASTAGQASPFAKTVPCNSEPLQAPVKPPVPSFPPELLPTLLPPPPLIAAPTAAVTSLNPLRTGCSPSASTKNNFPESSARQQTVSFVKGEALTVDSDSEEETGRRQAKENEPAAEVPVSTSVPKSGQNVPAAPPEDNGGNESDTSVKMMESPDWVIIDVAESDSDGALNVPPVHQEPPQKSISVEFSPSSKQTAQQNDAERKVQPTSVPSSVDNYSLDCVEVVEDEEPSVGAFENHTGPVHGLQVHRGRLYTCSGDNTARAYSLTNRECQAVFEGHTNKVNCLLVSSLPNMPARLYTGSSDQTIRCYSTKTTKCLEQISLSDRVLCLHIGWNILYAGLANGSVASHDVQTLKQLDVFECHGPRGVSCLGTAQEGARRVLLVGSYDSTISVRDAKSGLLLRSLQGHTKTVLCMKVVNDLVFSGSSDTSVHAHNIHTGELVRIYKGHNHAVTSIVILGKVMVTACLDKLIRVYELQSHDRLQVYGGHSDMVMCMAVHKSMIYTGCYDGSIQAVQLNLMKNFRCWWQNCTLMFGMSEHLVQHLVRDHSNPNLQAVKCRWRGCSSFFGTQQSVREKLPDHMQSHAENDSKVQP